MGFHKGTVSQLQVMEETYTSYKFHCDAVGCDSFLELDVPNERDADGYDIDLGGNHAWVVSVAGVYEGHGLTDNICESETDALHIALTHGWEEGDVGIQRGHIYCPKHKKAAQ